MPEGPEVRRIAVDLAKEISGKQLIEVNVLSGRYLKKDISGIDDLKKVLPDNIVGVGSHGKFLYILLSNGVNIWSTLGMTGKWSAEYSRYSRVQFKFSCGSDVYFDDIRNFGTLKFVYGANILRYRLKKLGPDMLVEDVPDEKFLACLRKRDKWNITKALMDQSIIAGVGNYIKAESLWLSAINPIKIISDITDGELVLLNKAIKEVMRTSYKHGGATFLTHKNFSGEVGDYSSRFLCYNRKLDAEGNRVIKTPTPDGRTTHWAPDRQK